MGDGGLALAAAVGTPYIKKGTRFKNPSMQLGPDAGDTLKNLELLKSQYSNLAYCKPNSIISVLVEALSHNQVLGMFKGKMEFGPRALCNRSIVYHATDRTVNDWLNARMHRTEFMPFAPVTAVEHAEKCYIGWQEGHVAADYMTMTYDCHPDFRENSPAVVHIDGTARPQVIRPNNDPFMHRLLMAWYEVTGQMALVNTSFNKHEEPIICNAKDAFDALMDGMVDIVVMNESTLIWKKRSTEFVQTRFE